MAFLVGDEATVARVREYSEFAWSPMSSLQLTVARHCLEDAGHLDRLRDGTRKRMEALRSVVERLGFATFPVHAGLYLLCRAPASIAGRPVAGPAEAAERLLADHGLAVVPWEVPPHGYLRFSGMYLPRELNALTELADRGELAGY